jgi:hypothetical protein
MQHDNAAPALRPRRSYVALVGAAALSAAALQMVRSTTAADLPSLLAQPSTLPIDMPRPAIGAAWELSAQSSS